MVLERARHTRPRPCVIMKLIASGVTFSAAMTRSPSFSRYSSSTSTISRPARSSASASSMVQNASRLLVMLSLYSRGRCFCGTVLQRLAHGRFDRPAQVVQRQVVRVGAERLLHGVSD